MVPSRFRFSKGGSTVRLPRLVAPFRVGTRPLEVSDSLENVEPERGAEEGRAGDDDPA